MKHLKKFEISNIKELLYAISDDDLDRVKKLIKSGINLEILYNNWTPLYYAVIYNKNEIVKELIKAGANINFKHEYDGNILIIAANNDNLQLLKLLIEAGVDWNIKDSFNKDFLDYLSDYQKQEIIKLYPNKYEEYLMKKTAEKYNI